MHVLSEAFCGDTFKHFEEHKQISYLSMVEDFFVFLQSRCQMWKRSKQFWFWIYTRIRVTWGLTQMTQKMENMTKNWS